MKGGKTPQFSSSRRLRRVRELPEGPEWQYEAKWDGYRMQVLKSAGTVRLISRNGADYTKRFGEVAQAVARLKPAAVHLDGELVAMDQQGRVNSIYEPGKRSGSWVKLPLKQMGRFLIGGMRPVGTVAVLLVGEFDGPRFKFAGKVCHGLSGDARADMVHAVGRRRGGKCPFVDLPNCKADPFGEMVTAQEMNLFTWLEPNIQVEVAFTEWTRFGSLRQAELVGG